MATLRPSRAAHLATACNRQPGAPGHCLQPPTWHTWPPPATANLAHLATACNRQPGAPGNCLQPPTWQTWPLPATANLAHLATVCNRQPGTPGNCLQPPTWHTWQLPVTANLAHLATACNRQLGAHTRESPATPHPATLQAHTRPPINRPPGRPSTAHPAMLQARTQPCSKRPPGDEVVQRVGGVRECIVRARKVGAPALVRPQVDSQRERSCDADGRRAAHHHVLDVRPCDLRVGRRLWVIGEWGVGRGAGRS
eukprot:364403-Chlamydomonas_euryale.AAC.14